MVKYGKDNETSLFKSFLRKKNDNLRILGRLS